MASAARMTACFCLMLLLLPGCALDPVAVTNGPGSAQPSTANCSVSWQLQPLDHFDPTDVRVWRQRVFMNDDHWRRPTRDDPGVIFFYCGNEASVELYVNSTGWMWERAASLGALLVFAEHRYCGRRWPCTPPTPCRSPRA